MQLLQQRTSSSTIDRKSNDTCRVYRDGITPYQLGNTQHGCQAWVCKIQADGSLCAVTGGASDQQSAGMTI